MPTKKKRRPSFNVPDEIGSGHDSGWVYRSAAEDDGEESYELETSFESESGLSSALAAMVQVVSLGIAVAAIPLVIGLGAFGAMASLAGPRRQSQDS
jgi:hypothetical protein